MSPRFANFDVSGLQEAVTRNRDRMSQFDKMETVLRVLGYGANFADTGRFRTDGRSVPGFVYGSPFGYFNSAVKFMLVDRAAYLELEQQRCEYVDDN